MESDRVLVMDAGKVSSCVNLLPTIAADREADIRTGCAPDFACQ